MTVPAKFKIKCPIRCEHRPTLLGHEQVVHVVRMLLFLGQNLHHLCADVLVLYELVVQPGSLGCTSHCQGRVSWHFPERWCFGIGDARFEAHNRAETCVEF